MKKTILLLLAIPLFFSCGDDDELSGVLYVDDVYSEVDIIFDVKYGSGQPLLGNEIDLYLDVYQPIGDNNDRRATIVMAHGGAFVTGTKSQIRPLCEAYARKGYTVASISYRLINDPNIVNKDSVAFAEGVVLTLSDMKGAIRYLRNDAQTSNTYNIDPDLIFAGGVSAGAIMANHVGFLDATDPAIPFYLLSQINESGGFEGNTNDLTVSSEVSGVLSFSGSLFRDRWIDEGDPPVFFVHEEEDPIVPCNYEATDVFPFVILAYGACELYPVTQDLGLKSEGIFYQNTGDAHVGYFSDTESALATEIIDRSAVFMSEIINGQ